MIIKSMGRKESPRHSGEGRVKNPLFNLVAYMTRDADKGESKAVLWNGFYGHHRMSNDDILRAFEENATLLKQRKNGNILYHEILSFSAGHKIKGEALERAVADIGQEYLRYRAPNQMAFGVMHFDTDHTHLHLMISSNEVGKSERVRLKKSEFGEIQKAVEAFVIARYPELDQSLVYGREHTRERLKTQANEQAMKANQGKPSRKEELKAKIHQVFERAQNPRELVALAEAIGARFYERGRSVGVIVRDPDGTERRHRLSTLGLDEHYALTKARLAPKGRAGEKEKPEKPAEDRGRKPAGASEERKGDDVADKTDREPGEPAKQEKTVESLPAYMDDILKKILGRDRDDGGKQDQRKPARDRDDDSER